jgi:hypothetical protein
MIIGIVLFLLPLFSFMKRSMMRRSEDIKKITN